MRRNWSSALPSQVLYLDTETRAVRREGDTEWHAFQVGVTCYARHRPERKGWVYAWRRWTDPAALIDYVDGLVRTRTCLYVIASNPTFDLWVLDAFHRLYTKGWRLKFFYDKGLTHILKVRRKRQSIIVLALQNYYPVGVASVGKMLGLPKLEVDIKTVSGEERWRYCERDVLILLKAFERWLEFVEEHDMGGFALTRTGQAFRAFRHRFMEHRILIHGHELVAGWERNAYFGGRTECFQMGRHDDGPFVLLDVHSMYSHMMRTLRLPYHLRGAGRQGDVSYLARATERDCVVAHVELDTDRPAYAVKMNDRVCFPVGRFDAWVCTPAFRYALRMGHLRSVAEWATYEAGPVFRTFIDYFYKLRQGYKAKRNRPYEQVCKYLLNGFYGKWAQQFARIIYEGQTDDPQLSRETFVSHETGQTTTVTKMLGKEWVESGKVEGGQNAVAIAAHITEGARLYLWELIDRLPRGEVIYCDTDSLLLRKGSISAYADVLDRKALGYLWPDKEAPWVEIRGLKDYSWAGVDVIKGIRKDARQTGPNSYRQMMFAGLYSLLRDAEPGLFPIIDREKVLSREYAKGTVDDSTGLVFPFRL